LRFDAAARVTCHVQGLKVCDVRSALFLLKATKEFKEKSSTLARCLVERMGLPEASLALPWDTPVHRSGRLEWDLGGMRFSRQKHPAHFTHGL
jgi:hypothetical protein